MARALPKTQHDERPTDATVAVLAPDDRPLRLNEAGLDLIRRRLEDANRGNPNFAAQRDRLLGAVTEALDGLLRHFAPEIERVVARGDWALHGIDLRTLPDAEDVVIEIVHRGDRPDFEFDQRVSLRLWSGLRRAYVTEFLLQYMTTPLPLWRHGLEFREYRRAAGYDAGPRDVPLLVRE